MTVVEREDKLADAKRQGQAQFDSIKEMVEALNAAENGNDRYGSEHDAAIEAIAIEAITQDALSVEVRSGWHVPGDADGAKPDEYAILLCTGGPAVRIVGKLSDYCQPETAEPRCKTGFSPGRPCGRKSALTISTPS